MSELTVVSRNSDVCRELVDGCADCALEADYKRSIGHECGTDCEMLVSTCSIFGKWRNESESFHELSHQPTQCENCQAVLRLGYDGLLAEPCRTGRCERWLCPACRHEWTSNGPIDCVVCGGYRAPLLTKMRTAYRRRRRYW